MGKVGSLHLIWPNRVAAERAKGIECGSKLLRVRSLSSHEERRLWIECEESLQNQRLFRKVLPSRVSFDGVPRTRTGNNYGYDVLVETFQRTTAPSTLVEELQRIVNELKAECERFAGGIAFTSWSMRSRVYSETITRPYLGCCARNIGIKRET
jgi:hypothetical protein